MGYCTPCTRQRYPTTARRGHFELLGVPPGPNRTSLDNLATPGSPRVSMLTSGLVRTPVQRDTKHSRTPALKPSSNSSLPVAWITGPATDSSCLQRLENWVFKSNMWQWIVKKILKVAQRPLFIIFGFGRKIGKRIWSVCWYGVLHAGIGFIFLFLIF